MVFFESSVSFWIMIAALSLSVVFAIVDLILNGFSNGISVLTLLSETAASVAFIFAVCRAVAVASMTTDDVVVAIVLSVTPCIISFVFSLVCYRKQ